jgi:hypothetical protein
MHPSQCSLPETQGIVDLNKVWIQTEVLHFLLTPGAREKTTVVRTLVNVDEVGSS